MYTVETFRNVIKGQMHTTIRTFRQSVATKAEAERTARKHKGAIITRDYEGPQATPQHHLVQKVRGTWHRVTRECGLHGVPFQGFQIRKW